MDHLTLALSPNGPFAALASYRQFIIVRFIPLPGGKIDKFPIDWRTADVPVKGSGGAHDPAIWLDAQTALATAAAFGPGYGVGFVFTENDPFWFLDIDGALIDGKWSDLSVRLCQQLAGAAVEISQSGKGLHIFGSGTLAPHRCKNVALGLELYTERRFVALTGTHASGSAAATPASIHSIAVEYFPATASVVADTAEWTEGPREGYIGPYDDDELIQRMLASQSAASAFGRKASIKQLWENDADALARAWAPQSPGKPYDQSSADAALANHLAWWTGGDCARVERLMWRSALVRDKWQRTDYMRETIGKAVAGLKSIPTAREPRTESAQTEGAPSDGGSSLVIPSEVESAFKGVIYISDRHAAWTPDGEILTPERFRVHFGGRRYCRNNEGKLAPNAWDALTDNEMFRPPIVASTCFRPEHPAGGLIEEDGRVLLNTYYPIEVPSREGDATPFLKHIEKLLPVKRDRDILVSFMAAAVQYPGVKFQWCPLIQGVEGNGKSLLGTCMQEAIGKRYTHVPNAGDLGNKFTGWLDRKLFISVEEVHVSDKRDVLDALKVLVTNRRIEIQRKGGDQVTGDNRANFMMFSNHKDAVQKTARDRRYAVLFTAQQEAEDLTRDGMGGTYFPDLWEWLETGGYAVVTHYLRHYTIPEELNPATRCHRAPATSSTAEAISASMGLVEQAVTEAIDLGLPGFCGGWISTVQMNRYLESKKLGGRVAPNKTRVLLKTLGYVPHPHLANGRTNNSVSPDGCKTYLYIKEGHLITNLTDAPSIARAYENANKMDVGFGRAVG